MKLKGFINPLAACTAIAIVAAFGLPACVSAAPIREEPLSAGIEFPWNFGWSMAISVVPGLPIQLSFENKDLTFAVTADSAQLVNWDNEKVQDMQQPVQMKSGDTVYWDMIDPAVLNQKDDVHYVEIIASKQSHITGYAVVQISSQISKLGGKGYVASVLKNVSFPKVREQYQTVSANYVRQKMNEVEGKK